MIKDRSKNYNDLLKEGFTDTVEDIEARKIIDALADEYESEKELVESLKNDTSVTRSKFLANKKHQDIDFIEYLIEQFNNDQFKLPMLPNIVARIIELSHDENADFKDYSAIIKSDPVIALKLLKYSNSAAYRGRYEVVNLDQAISRIGIDSVISLVIVISLRGNLFTSSISRELALQLWKKSLLTAIISSKVAEFIGIDSKKINDLYTLALIHNVGGLVAINEATNFRERNNNHYLPELSFLKRVIKSFENRLTCIILQKWNFLPNAIESVANIERIKNSNNSLKSRILYFSHQISKAIFSGKMRYFKKKELITAYKEVLKRSSLGVSPKLTIKLITKSLQEYQYILDLTEKF